MKIICDRSVLEYVTGADDFRNEASGAISRAPMSMIEILSKKDTAAATRIWLVENVNAHGFIPREYWEANRSALEENKGGADIYSFTENGEIRGFMGLSNGYVAGIFVSGKYQSSGIGKKLLDFAKSKNDALELDVYEKNTRAIKFYERNGFSEKSRGISAETGETEIRMVWRRE